jgi:hypothetical protein
MVDAKYAGWLVRDTTIGARATVQDIAGDLRECPLDFVFPL